MSPASAYGLWVVIKGVTIGALAAVVIGNHGLSVFDRALIVGVVSALIGAVGAILAAWLTARELRRGRARD